MQITPEEEQSFNAIMEVFEALSEQYGSDGGPYHMSHSVVLFCYQYFHDVCKPTIKDEADKAIASSGNKHFDIEPVIRGNLEAIFMTGYVFGQRAHNLTPCTCIEDIGDVVEAALKENGHG